MTKFILAIGVIFAIIAGVIYYNRGLVQGVVPIVLPSPKINEGEPLPFQVPEGFVATLYSSSTPGARVLIHDPRGALLVSLTSNGSVVALTDEDGNGVADHTYEVIKGLDSPHGLAFVCDPSGEQCDLVIAEETAVRRYSYSADEHKASNPRQLSTLPGRGGHSTRSLQLHPDGRHLLVASGSSCNVCDESDERRAAILSIDLQSGDVQPFATGLRNTVFMAIHPVTGEIWGTDMGRDLLGDDLPPDEVNILKEGGDYGWPFCYGMNVADTKYQKNASCTNRIGSHIDLQAHSAPLGIAFVPEDPPALGWPEEYWHDAIISYHGSWNRSVPTGYKIVRHELDDKGNPTGVVEDFMTGFMNEDNKIIGRPAGILIQPGGTMYVADDRAGAIYKISRTLE